MADSSVVEVYRAKNGSQAQFFAMALEEAGIEAEIQGDLLHPGTQTAAGLLGASVPWWDAPRILVRAEDAERAKRLLLELEAKARDARRTAESSPPIEAFCEECGRSSSFPATQRESVQDCPHCGAYLDVVGGESLDDSEASAGEEP